ncbi:unnamed protein product [Camellia sinensis]
MLYHSIHKYIFPEESRATWHDSLFLVDFDSAEISTRNSKDSIVQTHHRIPNFKAQIQRNPNPNFTFFCFFESFLICCFPMGTPAFPNLGKHCTVEDCKQIDFLPFTCDCCHQVFCLEHRSYVKHQCPNGNKNDVTVVICPLCAKGVRLMPDQDPNISWELHVNTDCDPSNYEKATKKRKCPVRGCREILTFSNTIKCRDCTIEHCLKHRFGPDHSCPGPKKPEATAFQFLSFLSRKEEPKPSRAPPTSSSRWSSSLLSAASSFRATAEAGMAKLSSEFSQKLQTVRDGTGQSSGGSSGNASRQDERCPQCNATFSSVTTLVEHVERVHERTGVMKLSIDVCPKCSRGFRDPVALVEHVEREHGGTSKA